jgi:hypothetical protein
MKDEISKCLVASKIKNNYLGNRVLKPTAAYNNTSLL